MTLLRPDNHDLWAHVRLLAIARAPVLSWEEIAARIGLDAGDVPELLAWFIAYRQPPSPRVLPRPSTGRPLTKTQAQERDRLRERETSLVTVSNEAPRQLIRIQHRIVEIEGE